MKNFEERLREKVRGITDRDEDLAKELQSVRDHATTLETPAAAELAEFPGFTADLALETIVLRTGRPVLTVSHNEPQLEFQDTESEVWRTRLIEAHDKLVPAIKAVGRIEVQNNPMFDWVGTGWLVDEDIVVTNRHVASEFARRAGETLVFRSGPAGRMTASIDFLEEVNNSDSLTFAVSDVLYIEPEGGPDVAFLRVRGQNSSQLPARIKLSDGVPSVGNIVAVIGYPARDSRIPEQDLMDTIFGNVYNKKRLAPGQLMIADANIVQHDASTLGGNSGSVVLSLATGEAVALHFSGRFLQANYAVPAAFVEDRLGKARSGSRIAPPPSSGLSPKVSLAEQADAAARDLVTLQIPLHIRVSLGEAHTVTVPITSPSQIVRGDQAESDADEPMVEARIEDYVHREGYNQAFLGRGYEVSLPKIAAKDLVTFDDGGVTSHILRYEHFSVVMNRGRRMCSYSAVNIDGKQSRRMKRGPWKIDPRIPRDLQILKECYGNPPKFSRGHMTRREDPIWGSSSQAMRGNEDSMHVTNVVPQMQPFNAPIWLGLEDYALEHAREDDMLISVFTGPFFYKTDPTMYGVRIPVSFWKVIVFIHDDTRQLCATGYTMSQRSFLRDEEFVFGQHETSQVPISTIEARSGLDFGPLRSLDPLRGGEEARVAFLTDYSQIKFT